MKNYTYISLIIATILSIFCACSQKTDWYNSDTTWINKPDLTLDEIIDSVHSDARNAKSYKLITEPDEYTVRRRRITFLDKKGNMLWDTYNKRRYLIDNKAYIRETAYEEGKTIATVLADVMEETTADESTIGYLSDWVLKKRFSATSTLFFLEDFNTIISVSGDTLIIKAAGFKKTETLTIVEREFSETVKDITVKYIPHKEIVGTIASTKNNKLTVNRFIFNTDEEVELPELMKPGSILPRSK